MRSYTITLDQSGCAPQVWPAADATQVDDLHRACKRAGFAVDNIPWDGTTAPEGAGTTVYTDQVGRMVYTVRANN